MYLENDLGLVRNVGLWIFHLHVTIHTAKLLRHAVHSVVVVVVNVD